jgi:hypothetical protein
VSFVVRGKPRGTAIYVDTVLGRITLHGKARSVQEKANDTNEKIINGGKENAKKYKRSEG